MSGSRKFLVCESELHAEVVDAVIAAYIMERDGNLCGSWSGVYAKPGLLSDTYGVIWEPVCWEVLGDPSSLTIASDENDEWVPVAPIDAPSVAE
jgi:hypothetical protein